MEQLLARRLEHVPPPLPAGSTPARIRKMIADQWVRRQDFWLGLAFSALVHALLLCGLALWKSIEEPAVEGLRFTAVVAADTALSGPIDALPVIDSAPAGDDGPIAEDVRPLLVDPARHLDSANPGDDSSTDAVLAVLPSGGAGGPGLGGGGNGGRGGTGEGGGGGGGIAFFGTRGEGRSFVFIVDYSGSMTGERVERAREELVRSINELKVYHKFFVFLYNTDTYPLLELSSDSDLLPASVPNRRRAIRWIRRFETGRGTYPQDAFRRALAMRPEVIFFLTDGEIPPDTRDIVRAANQHGTIIHTIGFQSREGEEILQAIAQDNHGRYRFVE